MAPIELLERATGISSRAQKGARMSVTDLARGTDWRKRLPEEGIIEVTDRGDTTAWLVSDQDMQALVEGFALLERELEQAQVAAIFATRETGHPESGRALRDSALRSFETRKDEFKDILNDN